MTGSELAVEVRDAAALPAAPAAGGPLKGRQKAAVLLIALGAQNAAEVLKHLTDREIEALSFEMSNMEHVQPELGQLVLDELAERVIAAEAMGQGGPDYARAVLEQVFGKERASEMLAVLSDATEGRPFDFVRRTPAEQIAAFVADEAPQTIALVISNLHIELAAQVLALLEPEEQAEVAMRIGTMRETSPEVIEAVESVLRQRLSNVVSQDYADAGGVHSLAEILNHTDRGTERNVLDSLAQVDAELAEEVRMLLFTFEDIVKLDDRSIQLVLKEVDSKDLAVALRGVAKDVQERIFSNMSERGGEMLSEEIQYMPAQKRVVVEEAQSRIVAIVRRLEEAGGIVISRGNDDEML